MTSENRWHKDLDLYCDLMKLQKELTDKVNDNILSETELHHWLWDVFCDPNNLKEEANEKVEVDILEWVKTLSILSSWSKTSLVTTACCDYKD